jgi:hypothetical protein
MECVDTILRLLPLSHSLFHHSLSVFGCWTEWEMRKIARREKKRRYVRSTTKYIREPEAREG